MSDSFRQVGYDTPGGLTAAYGTRKLKIVPKPTATYEYGGTRAALMAGRPRLGADFETIEGTHFYVTEVDIDDVGNGDAAKMIVTTEAAYAAESGTYEPIGEAQYGVKFQELRRKIEAHPCCGTLTTSALAAGKTWETWQALTDSDYIPAVSGDIPYFYDMGPWALSTYKDMKKKGTDEYVVYLPIVTRVLSYKGRVSGIGQQSGRRQNPPSGSFDFISSYKWLAGPDEIQQRGNKYERQSSWMGAEVVNTDLYPAST